MEDTRKTTDHLNYIAEEEAKAMAEYKKAVEESEKAAIALAAKIAKASK